MKLKISQDTPILLDENGDGQMQLYILQMGDIIDVEKNAVSEMAVTTGAIAIVPQPEPNLATPRAPGRRKKKKKRKRTNNG